MMRPTNKPNAQVLGLDTLMADHADALLAYVLRWTQDRQIAEDIVQETWVRAWRNQSRMVESHGSVRGWLNRVAHNLAVDHYRARSCRPGEVAIDTDTDAECLTAAARQEHVLDDALVREVLDLATPVLREALVEIYLKDRTVAQAAVVLGVPVGTVKSRLHYGLKELRASVSHLAVA